MIEFARVSESKNVLFTHPSKINPVVEIQIGGIAISCSFTFINKGSFTDILLHFLQESLREFLLIDV